jgi:hypothetical protein
VVGWVSGRQHWGGAPAIAIIQLITIHIVIAAGHRYAALLVPPPILLPPCTATHSG